ncbi:hypothetical protein [Humibacter sp. RRB41]|uniref:hypothetical protein n=1 Tax=Humibacter sp. RRB41 TaxID=2919946 RepID=UPI001FAA013A|nr:hypothetical protein [Humibacter sp. RRB41]
MRRAVRIVCAILGVALTATGLYFLLTTEPPAALLGLAVWLGAAVVLHDGVFAPAVYVANRILARGTARLPAAATTSVRILFGIGTMLTLVVAPELVAQSRPHSNPTILVGDYALRLGAVWGVIATAAVIVILWSARRTRRRSDRLRSTRV